MHHDKDFAVNRNGTRDIFLNTPNLASWFERYITDWTGPFGRLRRVTFRMLGSIFPGDTMVFRGTVTDTGVDDTGCGWVGSRHHRCRWTATPRPRCTARVALPVTERRQPVVPDRRPLDPLTHRPARHVAPVDTKQPQLHQRRTRHVGPDLQPRAGDAP